MDGILLLDKPAGLSSNQALQRVKRAYAARKAGHTGSLDPLATGMLPVCFGQATKVSAYLLDSDKVYRAHIRLGTRTSTGDAEGEIIATGPASVDAEELARVLCRFRGPIRQTPPMYSALKHQGRRLYELAREGREVERSPRTITIHEIEVEEAAGTTIVLRVRCSKGTYVRTLAEDIAREAGTVAHLADLRRIAVTPFEGRSMHSIEEVTALAEEGPDALSRILLPVDAALPAWPALRLDDAETGRIRQGKAIGPAAAVPPGMVRLYSPGCFLGIGERLASGEVVPRRLLAPTDSPRDGL